MLTWLFPNSWFRLRLTSERSRQIYSSACWKRSYRSGHGSQGVVHLWKWREKWMNHGETIFFQTPIRETSIAAFERESSNQLLFAFVAAILQVVWFVPLFFVVFFWQPTRHQARTAMFGDVRHPGGWKVPGVLDRCSRSAHCRAYVSGWAAKSKPIRSLTSRKPESNLWTSLTSL